MWKREPYTVPDVVFFMLGSLVAFVSYLILALAYHDLPAVIPVHYDLSGLPDAYAAKTWFSVFGVVLIHAGLSVLLLWMYAHPEYANIPGRVRLSKLKQPYRGSVEWIVRHMALMMFVLVSLIFSYLSLSGVVVGLGFASQLNSLPLAMMMLLLVAINLLYILMIIRITSLASRRKKLPTGW